MNPALLAALNRHQQTGRLIPGAAQHLANMWSSGMSLFSPAQVAEEVEKRLATKPLERYLNLGYEPDRGATALQAFLAGMVATGEVPLWAVDQMVNQWGVSMAGLPAPKVAGEVVRRLAEPENYRYLRHPPPALRSETIVARVIASRFRDVIRPGQDEALARDVLRREPMVFTQTDAYIVSRIAAVLCAPTLAATYTKTRLPLDADDPRRRTVAPGNRAAYERPAPLSPRMGGGTGAGTADRSVTGHDDYESTTAARPPRRSVF
jgi:hypothetical protein